MHLLSVCLQVLYIFYSSPFVIIHNYVDKSKYYYIR